eukprot:1160926-Pelagomonas_calceolata.AAC.9
MDASAQMRPAPAGIVCAPKCTQQGWLIASITCKLDEPFLSKACPGSLGMKVEISISKNTPLGLHASHDFLAVEVWLRLCRDAFPVSAPALPPRVRTAVGGMSTSSSVHPHFRMEHVKGKPSYRREIISPRENNIFCPARSRHATPSKGAVAGENPACLLACKASIGASGLQAGPHKDRTNAYEMGTAWGGTNERRDCLWCAAFVGDGHDAGGEGQYWAAEVREVLQEFGAAGVVGCWNNGKTEI